MLSLFRETYDTYGDSFFECHANENKVKIIKTWDVKRVLEQLASNNNQVLVETPNKQIYSSWNEVYIKARKNLRYQEKTPPTPKKRRQRNSKTSSVVLTQTPEVNFNNLEIVPQFSAPNYTQEQQNNSLMDSNNFTHLPLEQNEMIGEIDTIDPATANLLC